MHLLLSDGFHRTRERKLYYHSIPGTHAHWFQSQRLQIESTESLWDFHGRSHFCWECLIGPGFAWIGHLKITAINSCVAATQPDASSRLGRERPAITGRKSPERLVSLTSLPFFGGGVLLPVRFPLQPFYSQHFCCVKTSPSAVLSAA